MRDFFRNSPDENIESYIQEKHLHNYQRAYFLVRLSFVAGILLLLFALAVNDSINVKAGLLAFILINGIFWLATLERKPSRKQTKMSYEFLVIDGELILLPAWAVMMLAVGRSGMVVTFELAVAILVVGIYFVTKWQKLTVIYVLTYVAGLVAAMSSQGPLADLPNSIAMFLFLVVAFAISRINSRQFIASFEKDQLLRQRNIDLEQLLAKKAEELRDSERHIAYDIIKTLIKILEHYDEYTKGHSEHVAAVSRIIAIEMGMDLEGQEEMYLCGLVHDIGKLNIPLEILNKPANLSKEEKMVMNHHSYMSYELLADSKSLQRIAYIVKHHHEHWDGKGYPLGVKHDKIPLESQILMVADAWDAMRSTRVYRKAMSIEKSTEQLKKFSGTQFAPVVVNAVLRLVEEGRLV